MRQRISKCVGLLALGCVLFMGGAPEASAGDAFLRSQMAEQRHAARQWKRQRRAVTGKTVIPGPKVIWKRGQFKGKPFKKKVIFKRKGDAPKITRNIRIFRERNDGSLRRIRGDRANRINRNTKWRRVNHPRTATLSSARVRRPSLSDIR